MKRNILIIVLLAACIVLALLRSAVGTRLDSFTIDEPWHAVAGAAYVQHGDFALNPEHPPLVKLWAGAWLGRGFAVPATPPLVDKESEREFVESVMYEGNDDRAAQLRLRAAMWALHALLLALLAGLLWHAFGAPWAVAAMAIIAIEPSVGAYLPVVMTDLPVALALVIAALALGLLLSEWRWRGALLLGFALGLALASKHSALPGLLGLAVFAAGAWAWQARGVGARENLRRAAQLSVAASLAFAMVWGMYGFRFDARADGSEGYNRPMAAKLADLQSPTPRAVLTFVHRHRLLPESYLWGLADTVRAGIEGRGDLGVRLWGVFVEGPPRWYVWPSFILAKVPLALLALSLLGAMMLFRVRTERRARFALSALFAMGLAYGLSLMSAQSAYAGVRHAMPLVLILLVVAGAVGAWAWQQRGRRWLALPAGLWLLAIIPNLGESRLWEYHNALVGGTAGAHRYFSNESVELGQRLHEIEAFVRREVEPTGGTIYFDYWAYEPTRAWVRARGLPARQRVESIHDENVEGRFAGWFLKNVNARVAQPEYGWDPERGLRGLTAVVRLGGVEIWRGEQVAPRSRVWPLAKVIARYIYAESGDDWALVERRTAEIHALMPKMYPAALELANARLRLGRRAEARAVYVAMLEQSDPAIPPLLRRMVEAQVERLDSDLPTSAIEPLRSPMIE
jgi:hypothetical protein